MVKIIINTAEKRDDCKCHNEDLEFYRGRVIDALSALQHGGNIKEAEAVLVSLLEEIEDVLAEACRK